LTRQLLEFIFGGVSGRGPKGRDGSGVLGEGKLATVKNASNVQLRCGRQFGIFGDGCQKFA